MGSFSKKFKKKLVKEQKKAMNKIYKKAGLQGLLDLVPDLENRDAMPPHSEEQDYEEFFEEQE